MTSEQFATSREIDVTEFHRMRVNDPNAVLIDVRTAQEWACGYLDGAVHATLAEIETRVPRLAATKSTPIVVYCAGGERSATAAQWIRHLGYADVRVLHGGYAAAQTSDVAQYQRQVQLPEIGLRGQERLSKSRILCVGVGGLGTSAALQLTSAGVGMIGLVDPDVVHVSNLHRQELFGANDVGRPKVVVATEVLQRINPSVSIDAHELALSNENAARLIASYDVVIDGSDNYATRFALNDASLRAGIPFVHGSAEGFEGRMAVFVPGSGPCYRCMVPEPPHGADNGCERVGVMGAVTGVIGALQALEAMKVVLGIGTSATGRILIFDVLEQTFRAIEFPRKPDCGACGSTR